MAVPDPISRQFLDMLAAKQAPALHELPPEELRGSSKPRLPIILNPRHGDAAKDDIYRGVADTGLASDVSASMFATLRQTVVHAGKLNS